MRTLFCQSGSRLYASITRAGVAVSVAAACGAAMAQGSNVSVSANPSVLAAAAIPGTPASISRVGTIGETLHVVVGHSIFLNTKFRLRKVYVTDPAVLTSYTMSPNQIVVTAMAPGTSSLILQDENGQAQSYVVSSDVDVDGLRMAMNEAMRGDGVRVDGTGGHVVLSGTVGTDALSDTAVKLATLYSKDVANSLIVSPTRAKQVRLKVRILEVDRSKLTQFGVNIFNPAGSTAAGSTTGQFPTTATVTNQGGSNVLSISDPLNFLFYDWKYNIGATVKDLESKNVLQILAEPTITTISGQKANFLAGGEFPFPVIQPGGGSNATASVTIQFRPYGVKLEFTPIVHDDGSILLKVAPEVSALDYSNAVTISGYTIPALSTRRADTQVELRSEQSFAISGLLDKRITDVYNRNPGAASIPIIGALFKSKTTNHSNTELIVIVTPTLVDPLTDTTEPQTPTLPVAPINSLEFDKTLHQKFAADTRPGANSTAQPEPHTGTDPSIAPAVHDAPRASVAAPAAVAQSVSQSDVPATAVPQGSEPATTVVIPATATSATLSPTSYLSGKQLAVSSPLYVSAPAEEVSSVAGAEGTTPAKSAVAEAAVVVSAAGVTLSQTAVATPVETAAPVKAAEAAPVVAVQRPVVETPRVVAEAPKAVAATPKVEAPKPIELVAPAIETAKVAVAPEAVLVAKVEPVREVAASPTPARTPVIAEVAAPVPATKDVKSEQFVAMDAPTQMTVVSKVEAPKVVETPKVVATAPAVTAEAKAPEASVVEMASVPAAVAEKAAPALPEQPVAPARSPGVVRPSMVQVMAISHPEDAEAMVASLKRRGYDVAIKQDPRDSLLHLQMGPFPSRSDAEEIRQKLLSEGYNATIAAIQ